MIHRMTRSLFFDTWYETDAKKSKSAMAEHSALT